MTTTATHTNGLLSPSHVEKSLSTSATSARIIMPDKVSRILCIADIRGDYHELNRLIREHNATAVIHTGDFGFLTEDSLERMGDKILRHLLQYSPLIPPATRTQLLAIPSSAGRQALITALNNSSVHFPLSQFPHLLSGAITFPVPVFTVWGLIEDVRVAEKFRTGEYEVRNLSVIDEATSRLLVVGGLKLRLFGLGGAVAMHKLFDHGDGHGTISGGQGTMWLTALQIGELVDTAQRVADPTETRLFIASAPISRWGLLEQTALAVNADLTISGGLHFRYPASYNEYSVHGDFEQYRQKLIQSRDAFSEVYKAVKEKIDVTMSDSQMALLKKAVQTCQFVPYDEKEDNWTSTWHWVLSDASCGHMLLSISDGRVSAETKSNGLHFGHRNTAQPPSYPSHTGNNTASGPRNTQAIGPPPMSKPSANIGRPGANAAPAGIPAKPASSATPTAPANGGKGVPAKPSQAPTAPRVAAPLSGPAANGSSANTGASIPPKPPAQPSRQPRGPTSAATESGPNGLKSDGKSAQASNRSGTASGAVAKAPTPAGSRNSPAPGQKGEKSTGKDADKKDDTATETPKYGKKAEGIAEKHGDGQTSPTGLVQAKPHEKRSLYLKKLPIPTSEEEIRSLFPNLKDKITLVKLPYDAIKKQQREFAYVDFQTEADAQEALKTHEEKIRDTAVIVVISNPPVRNASMDFGSRGGRGGGSRGSGLRGGRGGGRFPSSAGAPHKSDSATGGDKPSGPPAEKKESAPAAPPTAKKD